MSKVSGADAYFHLYRIGVVDNSGRMGVAIALSEAVQDASWAWVPISHFRAIVHLEGTTTQQTVPSVYVPNTNTEKGTEDSFYDDPQDAIGSAPSEDMLITAGE